MSKREFPFEVLKVEDESVTLKNKAGGKTTLKINQEVDSWALMAIIERNGEPIAVTENHREKDGPILYITPKGTIACFSKSLEPTSVPEESCYLGKTLKEVLESDEDILGEEILSREGDPSYDEVAPCLPPLRLLNIFNRQPFRTTSFVGSRDCLDKPAIMEGVYTHELTANFVLAVAVPEIRRLSPDEKIYEGIVGGWLPVLRYKFERWEVIVFADPFPPTMWIQPVWIRVAKISEGHIKDIHYFDTYAPYPPRVGPDPKQFYTKLLELSKDWQSVLGPAMEIDVSEERIADLCKHSLVREMITRVGDWPKYGVFDRIQGGPQQDGFQDLFNSSVSTMLEWGLFDVARRYVDNYLSYFVRDDGSIVYRGPEIGQYGRQLTMLAQYYNYTKDHALLLKHHKRIKAIVDLLLSLREKAKKLPKEDPAYGMIAGRSEADSCLRQDAAIYDIPYYSNSAEDLRGFHDLGKVWTSIGKKLSRQDLIKEGEELVRESEELKKDMYNSIEKSMLRDLVPPHLPGVAGAKKPWDKIGSNHSTQLFINQRVYPEILHSGALNRDMVETIVRYQAKHHGTRLGIPGDGHEGFVTYGYGYGLLQHDLIREFLLLYYAHMAHMYTRGTWTATEWGNLPRSEASESYCTAAQVTIPCLTKWMLVFEDPNSSTVWLARGVPRRWLEDGKTIRVKGAPTKWGTISYEISSKMAQGKIKIELNLPEEGFGAAIHLRLRTPAKQKIQTVEVNGRPWTNFEPEEEIIILPADSKGRIAIEVTCDEGQDAPS